MFTITELSLTFGGVGFMLTITELWFTTGLFMLIEIRDWFRYLFSSLFMPWLSCCTFYMASRADSLFPMSSYTHWIIVSVRARPALSPSQTSCQSLVEFSRFRASLWLFSFDSQLAMFLKISWTTGMP